MNFKQDGSPTWPYDAPPEEPASLFYPLHYGNELDRHHYVNAIPFDTLEAHPGYYPGWNTSPFDSPRSSSSPTSSGPEELTTSNSSISRQSFTSFDHGSRSTSGSPPDRLHSRFAHPFFPEPEPPIVHQTFEVETGEDAVIKALIHRLTDEEKRSLDFSASSRPTFCCNFRDCGKWLFHRAQIKPHLSEHGYRFCKPFKCACGADFGRQVEAARHVEDKKLCEQCHRSGRKYKGGVICLRCLRRLGGQ